MFKLNYNYLAFSIGLFAIEVFIALFVNDTIIRPFGGDFLVVILLYCLTKSFFNTPMLLTAIAVLLFSYLVEGLQYLHVVNLLGLNDSKLANVIIGNSFSWVDMLCYTLGILTVMGVEWLRLRKTGSDLHRKNMCCLFNTFIGKLKA